MGEAGGQGGDERGGVGAAYEVTAAVGKGEEEAVGGFAIEGAVSAYGGFREDAVVAEEAAASDNAFLGHGGGTHLDGCDLVNGDGCATQRGAECQAAIIEGD